MASLLHAERPNFVKDVACGAAGAAISKTLLSPMVVVHLHTMGIHHPPVRTMSELYLRIIKEEGISALYKGNIANIKRFAPRMGLQFGLFDNLRGKLGSKSNTKLEKLQNAMIAGAIAGGATFAIFLPFDSYRQAKLTLINGARYEKKVDYKPEFKEIMKKSTELTKKAMGGFVAHAAVFNSLYYGLYYFVEPQNIFLSVLTAWGVCGIAGLTAVPLDNVARRRTHSSKNQSMFHIAKDMLLNEGWQSFFKGGYNFVTRGLSPAIVLVAYDRLQRRVYR